jgi:hypothetical protein
MRNTVNASIGFSGFQLHLSRSLHLIPPMVPTNLPDNLQSAAPTAEDVVSQIRTDVMEAQDNLLQAKIFQEHYANSNRGDEVVYQVGDQVMLSTFNHHQEYCKKGDKRAAKFFPQWDGPYKVIKSHPESSSYTLELPTGCGDFPTYYASELKLHIVNDPVLFPSQEHARPRPVLTPDGLQEHEIECIIDSCPCGRSYQFLIQWKGFGPEDDEWLHTSLLEDRKALDVWYESGGDGLGSA